MITILVGPECPDIVYDMLLTDWHKNNPDFESTVKNFLVIVAEPFDPGTRLDILYNGEHVLNVPLDEVHQYENREVFAGLGVVVASAYPPPTKGLGFLKFTPEINDVIVQ